MNEENTSTNAAPREGEPRKFLISQKFLFALALFFFLSTIPTLHTVGRDRDTGYVYAAIAFGAFVALIHLPYVFDLLPKKLRVGAYATLLASFFVTQATTNLVQEAYRRSPAGAKDAASASQKKEMAESSDSMSDHDAEMEAAVARIEAEANGEYVERDSAPCVALVPSVIEMAQEKSELEIIEINKVQTVFEIGNDVECQGFAVTDKGDAQVNFKTETTEQGHSLLRMSFPNGFR